MGAVGAGVTTLFEKIASEASSTEREVEARIVAVKFKDGGVRYFAEGGEESAKLADEVAACARTVNVGTVIDFGYFPFVGLVLVFMLATLYHWALRHPLPWHRLLPGALLAATVFWIATYGLRLYLTALSRSGYTYGALATPIAFLLFAFFLGFAIVVGAEFNATLESIWPSSPTRGVRARHWLDEQRAELAEGITDGIKALPAKLGTGPISVPSPPTITQMMIWALVPRSKTCGST